ncbi:FkbM family methyltransferase [Pantoea ananatis]|uniref:FkbM family methyltransferase n=1 Tax=Pantoea ananas TaxID=553 RepID=UPI001B3022AB|nr:FkbM family methyltransferase [Pantoea ananatis]
MHFLTRIVEKKNHFLMTLNKMYQGTDPVVLIGAGCLANMTSEYMDRNHFRIDHVAINEQYFSPEQKLNNYPVESLEKLIQSGKKYNFIIALQYVTEELLDSLSGVKNEVLVYDPSFIGVNTSAIITYDFCEAYADTLQSFYETLGDDKSRDTFVAFINQRISARPAYIKNVYDEHHYFPDDIVALSESEVFVDCGAYNGDSINAFEVALANRGFTSPEKIYAFEPDDVNYDLLCTSTQAKGYCECHKAGVWSEETTLYFESGKALSSKLSENVTTNSISLTTVDNIVADNKVTFIKMDIEGAELSALEGAKNSIQRCHPLLAISAYHKPDDLIKLPAYIKSIMPGYRFYLRAHHPVHAFELVLYAIPA